MRGATLDEIWVNTVPFLAVDMVEASMAFTLWDRFLKHDPKDPDWPDRDRFILSNGYASALLYSLLHLNGYDLSMDELNDFRQWGSKTPGHPEYRLTSGVHHALAAQSVVARALWLVAGEAS